MKNYKKNARVRLKYAVDTGKLKRLPCEVCGSKKSEGHHPDYSKPLEVRWLCKFHHVLEHNRNRMMRHRNLLEKETITEEELPKFIAACSDEFGLQSHFAKHLGVSPSFLSDAINGRRGLSDKTLSKLGLERIIEYVEIKPSSG